MIKIYIKIYKYDFSKIFNYKLWGVERSPSRLKPTYEIGYENEIGPGLAIKGKSKKGIGCNNMEVKPHI